MDPQAFARHHSIVPPFLTPRVCACIALCFSVALLASCAQDGGPPGSSVAGRDSAGVTIIENQAPHWTAQTQWRIADRPTLQIGEGADGTPDRQFGNVTAVHRLENGTIAVLDAWAPGLFFFDDKGGLLGRAGREGSGPGEFPPRSRLTSFACGGDTVYVETQRRVSAFTPPNTHVRTFTLEQPVRLRACARERFLALQWLGGGRTAPGIFTDSVGLALFDRMGSQVAVIDTVPLEERDWTRSAEGIGYSLLLFGNVLSAAARDTLLVTGFSDRFQLEVRGTSGALQRIIRVDGLDRRVDAADVDRFRAYVMNPWRGNEIERAHLESRLGAAVERARPVFAELRLDRRGNIWARLYDHLDAVAFYDYANFMRSAPRPVLDEPRRWVVIGADGRYLGQLDTPSRFVLYEIGDDWILGVWRDEFDVQFVRQYALIKP